MKRKKWTEEEEHTLIQTYSTLLSSSSSSATSSSSSSSAATNFLLPLSRQKKFQPIADRVNSLHHLLRPHSFPFLWSWRDVSVKIHNMRHQYLHVIRKLDDSFDLPSALSLWPNFLRYREVFGDAQLQNPNLDDDEEEEGEEEEEEERLVWGKRKRREEEERREMEWMERLLVMQMEHERRAVEMHAEACRAHIQVLGVLSRLLCQLIGPHGLPGPVVAAADNLQQREQEENGMQ